MDKKNKSTIEKIAHTSLFSILSQKDPNGQQIATDIQVIKGEEASTGRCVTGIQTVDGLQHTSYMGAWRPLGCNR